MAAGMLELLQGCGAINIGAWTGSDWEKNFLHIPAGQLY